MPLFHVNDIPGVTFNEFWICCWNLSVECLCYICLLDHDPELLVSRVSGSKVLSALESVLCKSVHYSVQKGISNAFYLLMQFMPVTW